MTSFSVLSRADGTAFDVERLDINQWILPGVFGRQVILCDIGLRLRLAQPVTDQKRLKFDLGLPFTAREQEGLRDLVPVMQDKADLCSLIFGDIKAIPHSPSDGVYVVNDDGQQMQLERCDTEASHSDPSVKVSGRPFTLWTVVAQAVDIPAGTSVYLRFRFRVKRAGSTWAWQSGGRRRSHAISDMRVSELRDKPEFDGTGPDFTRTRDIERVNGFVITPARLKAGRTSPEPKYVRILEGGLWDSYLNRRLSRSDEPFVATYWTRESVNRDKPFRAFLEVERRRPTAARWAAITMAFVVVALLLLQPARDLRDSVIANTVAGLWAVGTTLIGAGVVTAVARYLARAASNGKWRRLAKVVDWWESLRYKR